MKNVILEYIGHSDIFYAVYSLFYERLGYNVFVLEQVRLGKTNSRY